MKYFRFIKEKYIENHLSRRAGESKIGEFVSFFDNKDSVENQLKKSTAKYVVFGISEDLGVRLNNGIAGTDKAWSAFLKQFLNLQYNQFLPTENIVIAGNFDISEKETEITQTIHTKKQQSAYHKLIEALDKQLAYLTSLIVSAGKIPIAIGGGHNNAYGLIKGCALAKGKPINAINFDAHTDLRSLEGRHSGNGFMYAISEGFLDRYFVFGLHESYSSQKILDYVKDRKSKIQFATYESIGVRKQLSFNKALKKAEQQVSKNYFGLEIDCDAIENMPSSAQTPSGFSMQQARRFVNYFGSQKTVSYLHICEAAVTKKNTITEKKVGKSLNYLFTDFVKALHKT